MLIPGSQVDLRVGLTEAETAAALKDVVGGFGFDWMASPEVRARGKAELGLRGRDPLAEARSREVVSLWRLRP